MIEISQEIRETLREIGLDRTEQQVYVLLLKKGLLGIADMTKELKLPRSSVHLACENLLVRGVLRLSAMGKRRAFYIENPKNIENFVVYEENKLHAHKLALESIFPRLAALHAIANESEPIEIKELQGEEGFVETFYRSLEQPKGSDVLRFGGDPALFTVAREKLKIYREKRVKKEISSKILMPRSEYSELEIKDARFKMREVRILEKDVYDPKVNVSTWQDNVAITVWDKGLHSVIIQNKAIAGFFRQMFKIAWTEAKEE